MWLSDQNTYFFYYLSSDRGFHCQIARLQI